MWIDRVRARASREQISARSPMSAAVRRAARTAAFVACAAAALELGGTARAARPRAYAIEGARIVVAPGKTIASGTVVIRDGTIESVGADVRAPVDAEIVDGKGLTVFAGLIDAYTSLGLPRAAEGEGVGAGRPGQRPQEPRAVEPAPERSPGRPNPQVRADTRAALLYQTPSTSELGKMHKVGFTTVLVAPGGGVFRGTSALVHLSGADPSKSVVASDVAQHIAFETSRGSYPGALMGVIALIRQTFEDARRHASWKERWLRDPLGLERPPLSPALDAVQEILAGRRPLFVEADDTHAYGRIQAIAREFSLSPIIVACGYEYEILEEVKNGGAPLILPVAFPDSPHLDDEDAALDVATRDLRRWDLAPGGPAALAQAGVRFALTSHRLRSISDFRKNVRKAIERGLSEDQALEALTIAPARMLGVSAILGTVEAGKIADLVLADGDLFAEKTEIKKLFLDGVPIELEKESEDFDPDAKVDPRGTWEVTYTIGGRSVRREYKIGGSAGSYSGTAETQAGTVTLTGLALTGNKLTGSYVAGSQGTVEFTWIIKGEEASGSLALPNGSKVSFSAKRTVKPEGGAL